MKKVKLNKKNLLKILRIIFVILVIISSIKIVLWNKNNKATDKIVKNINKSVKVEKYDKGERLNIDFKKLKQENQNVVGYLKVNNTNISYPVVKYTDNDYYLYHSFDNSRNNAGWIFMNYQNKLDGTDQNISIFGHARLDGSMFGSLKKVLDKKWQESKENRIITFVTEKEYSRYEVFSTYKIKEEDYYIQPNYTDYNQFLKNIQKRSNYDYKIDTSKVRQVLTLSTCDTNENYRIVLHAAKI